MWYYLFLTFGLTINKPKHNKMWDGLFDKVTYWRNVIYMILITFWTITGLKKKKKKNLIFHILKERDITYLPSHFHLFISCTKVQLIHFIIHFHLIHFTDHSPSHSHSPYLVLLMLHCISTSPCLSFFEPIPSLETRSAFR